MTGNAQAKAQLHVADEQRKMATRDMMLNLHRHRKVEFIDSLGANVAFVSMGARARDRIEQEAGVGTEMFNRHTHIMLSLLECIEEPKLTEKDLEEFGDQDIRIIDELVLHVTLINTIGGDAEEAKKSLPTTPGSDSDSS